MPRTKAIFEWIFSLSPRGCDYNLEFIETPDKGIDPLALGSRKEKEAKSLKQLLETKKEIKTIQDFSSWLFKEHSAYATSLEPKKISKEELKSY